MVKKLSFILISLAVLTITVLVVPTTAEVSLENLNQQVQSLQAQKDHYDFLKQEITEYRQFIIRQQEEHWRLINLYLNIGTGLVVVVGIIAGFFCVKTKKDIEKNVENYCQRHLIHFVDEKNKEITISLRELQRKFEEETAYKKASILILAPQSKKNQVQEDLVIPLRERGIEKIQIETGIDGVITAVRNNCFRVIVRYYEPEPQTKEEGKDMVLHHLVDFLAAVKTRTPLYILTSGVLPENKLSDNDSKKINDYRYAMPANYPLALLERVLTNIFAIKNP